MQRLIVFLILSIQSLSAYEVDNFSAREKLENLPDGLNKLNNFTNSSIQKALRDYNRRVKNCALNFRGSKKIYDYLRGALNTNPVGVIEDWAETDRNFPRIISPEENIYSGSSASSGFVRFFAGLESSTKVNGHIVGVDKFGHFMSQGFEYFELNNEGKVNEIFNYGIDLEEGHYGLMTTGIKSFGDLGANFSGMSFWENVINGPQPYVICINGKAVQNRKFNWADYVNDSWDEATNCSVFKESLNEDVTKNLKKLKLTCPINKERCEKIVNLDCAEYFVSPLCLNLFPERSKSCSILKLTDDQITNDCSKKNLEMPLNQKVENNLNELVNSLGSIK